MTDHAQADDQTTIAELQKKLSRLRRKLKQARAEGGSPGNQGSVVSPLAPENGFPDLPSINGVEFATAEAGVKYSGRADVMLAGIASGSVVAGVFTRSATRAAPVLDCQAKLDLHAQETNADSGFAVLVNSGNANAFTGAVGLESVARVTRAVADELDIAERHVFTASTGVIGERLPDEKITDSVGALHADLGADNIPLAARAIMTTDTYPKGACAEVNIGGKIVRITGFAKGSGMIAPDMATMLVFIFTDAAIARNELQKIVTRENKTTFNSITVDSDTSTSDTVLVFATGASKCQIHARGSKSNRAFSEALGKVMRDLAHQVVRDGEGATKFVEVEITGAKSARDARKAALAIANSPLVKTAVAGADPNWGRVVMAIGKSGAAADRDKLNIRFGEIVVAENGLVSPDYQEQDGAQYMKNAELKIAVDLGLGAGAARVWTCDLTKQYIAINADYRS